MTSIDSKDIPTARILRLYFSTIKTEYMQHYKKNYESETLTYNTSIDHPVGSELTDYENKISQTDNLTKRNF